MAIIFNETAKTYTIETKNTTYQMKINPFGVLLHTYYGRKIENDDLSYTAFNDMCQYTPKTEFIKGDETERRLYPIEEIAFSKIRRDDD